MMRTDLLDHPTEHPGSSQGLFGIRLSCYNWDLVGLPYPGCVRANWLHEASSRTPTCARQKGNALNIADDRGV